MRGARRIDVDQRDVGAGERAAEEAGQRADHARTDDGDLAEGAGAGIPHGVERGLHVGGEHGARGRDGRPARAPPHRPAHRTRSDADAARTPCVRSRGRLERADRGVAVFHREREVARHERRAHALVLRRRHAPRGDQRFGAAADRAMTRAHPHRARRQRPQRLVPDLGLARPRRTRALGPSSAIASLSSRIDPASHPVSYHGRLMQSLIAARVRSRRHCVRSVGRRLDRGAADRWPRVRSRPAASASAIWCCCSCSPDHAVARRRLLELRDRLHPHAVGRDRERVPDSRGGAPARGRRADHRLDRDPDVRAQRGARPGHAQPRHHDGASSTPQAAAERFHVYILSDTNQRRHRRRSSKQAFDALAAQMGAAASPVTYRRRDVNTGFKAGNIRDFLERWGDRHDFMVTLDADSFMTAAGDPAPGRHHAGATRGSASCRAWWSACRRPAPSPASSSSACASACGRGRSAAPGGRPIADPTGATTRSSASRPSRRIARSRRSPASGILGGDILSHDQIEAALMRRAGYDVRVLPEEDLGWEENPPTLIEFLRRDQRWLPGHAAIRLLHRPAGPQAGEPLPARCSRC